MCCKLKRHVVGSIAISSLDQLIAGLTYHVGLKAWQKLNHPTKKCYLSLVFIFAGPRPWVLTGHISITHSSASLQPSVSIPQYIQNDTRGWPEAKGLNCLGLQLIGTLEVLPTRDYIVCHNSWTHPDPTRLSCLRLPSIRHASKVLGST